MNAVDFLKAHHRQVERTFARLEIASHEQTDGLFERLADSLATHAQLEQRLCSAVAIRIGDDALTEQQGSYSGIARVVAELLQGQTRDETFAARMTILRELVRRHIRRDEAELFLWAKQLLSDGELEALGHDMEGELIRLYARGIPRRFFENQAALLVQERDDEGRSKGQRARALH